MSYPSCAGALMWSLASVVLTALDPYEQLVDATLAICLVRNGVEGQAAGTEPGNEQIEVEAADQLQALDVVAAIAGPVEQHHPPVAASEHDRVAREQAAMLTARPQVRGRAARVPGRGDHLEVAVDHVPLGEGLIDGASFRDGAALVFVAVQRGSKGGADPVAAGAGLVTMVEVLACDAAQLLDRPSIGLERARAVDEHVAALSLQQEGATLERGAKWHRLRSRRVQAFNYRLRGRSSSQ